MDAPVPLEAVITTAELNQRPSRPVDHAAVNSALVTLMQEMVNSPGTILQRLADTALDLCQAHSAGISLLEDEDGRKIFRWHAMAGRYAPYLWGTTPREFSLEALKRGEKQAGHDLPNFDRTGSDLD
jgi:hypothetical protein